MTTDSYARIFRDLVFALARAGIQTTNCGCCGGMTFRGVELVTVGFEQVPDGRKHYEGFDVPPGAYSFDATYRDGGVSYYVAGAYFPENDGAVQLTIRTILPYEILWSGRFLYTGP